MDFKETVLQKLRDLISGGFRDKLSSKLLMSLGLNKGFKDNLYAKGSIKFRLIKPNGDFVEFAIPNTITQLGDALVADAMSDRGVALPTHMAVGTATGSKTAASTTLQTELARVALDSTAQGTGGDDNDVTWIATFPAGTGTGAIVEAGVFNATPAGTMFCFGDFAVINKGALDILTITWTLTCGAS
jgi:hypothetical protein